MIMTVSNDQKERIKAQIREKLSKEQKVKKIVIFGSFTKSNEPNAIDIAIFQNSNERYLPLAMKYRKLVSIISQTLPIDGLPLKNDRKENLKKPANQYMKGETNTWLNCAGGNLESSKILLKSKL